MRLITRRNAEAAMTLRSGLIFAAALISACNKPISTPPDASTGGSDGGGQSAVIGPAGGTVSLSNGTSVTIPAGALSSATTITISQDTGAPTAPGTTLVGTPVVLGPEGTQFSTPVTVTLAYEPTLLPAGVTASQVAIFTSPVESPSFAALTTTAPDSTHVQAQVSHFSIFEPGVANASDAGPVSSDAGPVSSDAGPISNDAGPVSSDAGPISNDAGPASSDAGPISNDAGPVSSDAGPVFSDAGPVSVDAGVSCTGDGGCWSCAPVTQPEFLNQCTGSQCSGFDNASRLQGLYPDGGLPPLP
jgi:hypothetical protein